MIKQLQLQVKMPTSPMKTSNPAYTSSTTFFTRLVAARSNAICMEGDIVKNSGIFYDARPMVVTAIRPLILFR